MYYLFQFIFCLFLFHLIVCCVCLFSLSHSIAFISVVRLEIECVIFVCLCVLKINGGIDDAFKIVKLKKMYTANKYRTYLIYTQYNSERANTQTHRAIWYVNMFALRAFSHAYYTFFFFLSLSLFLSLAPSSFKSSK